jgi:hypothetical protein
MTTTISAYDVEVTFSWPTPVLSERGIWNIEHASKPQPVDRGNGIISTTYSLQGEPSANVDVEARIAAYPVPENLEERIQDALASGTPVTILKAGSGGLGAHSAQIVQGRLFTARGGALALLPTGKRSQGFLVRGALDMIDDAKPAAVTELNRRWYESTHLPVTVPLTRDVLLTATEENPVVFLYTHPGFGDGREPGCVWFIDDFQGEDDIANGFLWCPEGSALTSEHGSTYLSDALRGGALVPVTPSIDFAGMFELPSERLAAYARLFG